MVAHRNTIPGAVLGFDFAGTVQQLGPDVSTRSIHIGQRVSGLVFGGDQLGYSLAFV